MPNYSPVFYNASMLMFFKARKKLEFSSDYYGEKKKKKKAEQK